MFWNGNPDPLGYILCFSELLSLLSGRAGRDAKKKMLSCRKPKSINLVICYFLFNVIRITIDNFRLDNFILMTSIFTKLIRFLTIISSLVRLNNIKLKITGWVNHNYTNFELWINKLHIHLAKRKQGKNRSNESTGLPEINDGEGCEGTED